MDPAPDIAVLVADLPGPSRTALGGLIRSAPGLSLAGEISTLADLHTAVSETQPDVVLLADPLLRGAVFDARQLDARVVMTGVDDDPGYAARARRIGAVAWVPKEQGDELLRALRSVPLAPAGLVHAAVR